MNQGFHKELNSERMRSPIAAAAILLGVYVAMYLAVAGIVHLLTPPDATARVPAGNWVELSPDTSTAFAAAIDRSTSPQENADAHAN